MDVLSLTESDKSSVNCLSFNRKSFKNSKSSKLGNCHLRYFYISSKFKVLQRIGNISINEKVLRDFRIIFIKLHLNVHLQSVGTKVNLKFPAKLKLVVTENTFRFLGFGVRQKR